MIVPALFAAVVVAAAASLDVTDGAAFARDVAAAYALQAKGVESFLVTTTFDARGGPIHKSGYSQAAYVVVNGVPARHRVLKNVEDNRASDGAHLAAMATEPEGPLSHFGLRLPYLAGAVADYRYAPPRETATTIDLDFTTIVKDEAHGNGTLSYDRTENRIARVVFVPAALPAHATAMTVTVDFGRTHEERWDVVKISRAFSGREGIISGKGTSISVYERYRGYPSESVALAALDALPSP